MYFRLESGSWVVAILDLCLGTSSGAVLMQVVLCNPDLDVGENQQLDGRGYQQYQVSFRALYMPTSCHLFPWLPKISHMNIFIQSL